MAARPPAAEDGLALLLTRAADRRTLPPETRMHVLLSHLRRSAPARFNPVVLSGAALASPAAPPAAPAAAPPPAVSAMPAGTTLPSALPATLPATALADAALPSGPACGWFESSWDLQQGLRVSEWPDSDGPVAALWFATLAASGGAGSVALQ